MYKTIAISALLLTGCATAKQTYLPDGTKGYMVKCDGSALSWSMCYEKAGAICKNRGYDIVNKQEQETPFMASVMVTRSLAIRCKE